MFVVLLSVVRGAEEGASGVSTPVVTTMTEYWTAATVAPNEPCRIKLDLQVTYYDPFWPNLFWAQDSSIPSYLPTQGFTAGIRAGQRIRVEGVVVPAKGFVFSELKIAVLAEHDEVVPLEARGRLLDAATLNGRLVTAEGCVSRQVDEDSNHFLLDLDVEGVRTTVRVLVEANAPIPQLEGAFVRVSGVYLLREVEGAPKQVELWCPSPMQLKILGWLENDPRFDQPVTPVDQLGSISAEKWVRVAGNVHSQKLGQEVVLRDATGQVTLHTALAKTLEPGTAIEAIGQPQADGLRMVLNQALYRRVDQMVPAPEVRGLPILRLAEQVRELPVEEAGRGYPVRLRGVVTWSDPNARFFYVRDVSAGLRIERTDWQGEIPVAGARVDLNGRSAVGEFAPVVLLENLSSTGTLPLPEPPETTLQHLMSGVEDSQSVAVSGYVRTVFSDGKWSRLEITTPTGALVVQLPRDARVSDLAGSVVRVRGVCAVRANDRRQLNAVQLWVQSIDDIRVEEPRPADPFAVPLHPIASLRQFATAEALNRRVRIQGVLVHQEPGQSLHLQHDADGLMVLSSDSTELMPGDKVEAVGFPGRQGRQFVLREAVYRRLSGGAQPDPRILGELRGLDPDLDGLLVQVEATVLESTRRRARVELIGQSGSVIFDALLNESRAGPWTDWRPGSRLRLTGLYQLDLDESAGPRALRIQLRTPRDVEVLQGAAWWTEGRALIAMEVLVAVGIAGLAWVVLLRRRVARQTAEIRAQWEKAARLEAELMRTSKLESLGVFAGGIAHDFNNLLTVILGNLTLARLDDGLSPESAGCLAQSERAAHRARDLTQQLLTFARGGSPVRDAVQLEEIVRESTQFALHGAAVRVEFDIAPGLWSVEVDKGQIGQVVQNILLNATQEMAEEGKVQVTLRNETVTEVRAGLAPGKYVKLSVSDTGAGIPPETLGRIFEPYFTTKQQGNGLGLATVYSIVKRHGGQIEVESALGRGSTFHVWLPALDPAAGGEALRQNVPALGEAGA
ncbi:MAG TPA: ATP-binding protein [Opitutus sp.]|nr:ATP-binding protein [Opitutus sp.]